MWVEYIKTWSVVEAFKIKMYYKRENIPCMVKCVKGQFIVYLRKA